MTKEVKHELPQELRETLGKLFPPKVVEQVRSSFYARGQLQKTVEAGFRSASDQSKEEFQKVFNPEKVSSFIDSFFEEHMKKIVLGIIGFEESWHSGLQPKSHQFETTVLYRSFMKIAEEKIVQILVEKFEPALKDITLSRKEMSELTKHYRQSLQWKLEKMVSEKAEQDAEEIFKHITMSDIDLTELPES